MKLLLLVLSLCADARGAAVARPAPAAAYVPASRAWGFVLRDFFESDFGRSAELPPVLSALRPLDLVRDQPRLLAAPLSQSLAAHALTPGLFAGLPPRERLAALLAGAEEASREAALRGQGALAEELPVEGLEDAAGLLEQLAGPLSLYVPAETAQRAADAYPALKQRAAEARAQGLLASAEKVAEALRPQPPHMKVRLSQSPQETAVLAGEFSAALRRARDPEAKRELVAGLWEVAEAAPSREAHRVAARALTRELGRRRKREEQHRLLVLRAMKALADKTPYEDVERRLVKAALEESARAVRDSIAREADFVAGSVAELSPFPRVRRLALKQFQSAVHWTGDDKRRAELERRISSLQKPPREGYWPMWKPPRPTFWERARELLGWYNGLSGR